MPKLTPEQLADKAAKKIKQINVEGTFKYLEGPDETVVLQTENGFFLFQYLWSTDGICELDCIAKESKIKLEGDELNGVRLYVNNELAQDGKMWHSEECKSYKCGEIIKSEIDNSQTYVTIKDKINGNKETEIVIPQENGHFEKGQFLTYRATDKKIYIDCKNFENAPYSDQYSYHRGTLKDKKHLLDEYKKEKKFIEREEINNEIKKAEELKKRLHKEQDNIAQHRPDALNKNKVSKESLQQEKKTRIRKLSPEHQKIIQQRAMDRKTR